uniref:STAS domain-containing protein n=2 Tax=Steinernema glaseri TaxID=37863 RepID=A0A1I8AIF2_9BILA
MSLLQASLACALALRDHTQCLCLPIRVAASVHERRKLQKSASEGHRHVESPQPYNGNRPLQGIRLENLVIDCTAISYTDVMGANALKEITQEMLDKDVTVFVAGAKVGVKEVLSGNGFFKTLSTDFFLPSITQEMLDKDVTVFVAGAKVGVKEVLSGSGFFKTLSTDFFLPSVGAVVEGIKTQKKQEVTIPNGTAIDTPSGESDDLVTTGAPKVMQRT